MVLDELIESQVVDSGDVARVTGSPTRSVSRRTGAKASPRRAAADRLLELKAVIDQLRLAMCDEPARQWRGVRTRTLTGKAARCRRRGELSPGDRRDPSNGRGVTAQSAADSGSRRRWGARDRHGVAEESSVFQPVFTKTWRRRGEDAKAGQLTVARTACSRSGASPTDPSDRASGSPSACSHSHVSRIVSATGRHRRP